jgi:hypothetical protein
VSLLVVIEEFRTIGRDVPPVVHDHGRFVGAARTYAATLLLEADKL